jgi:DNA-binding LacI/PurR family transcriptional regulator
VLAGFSSPARVAIEADRSLNDRARRWWACCLIAERGKAPRRITLVSGKAVFISCQNIHRHSTINVLLDQLKAFNVRKKRSTTTIKDVAKYARVSVGTVSNVLSDSKTVGAAVRARVQNAIARLDYHPDRIARSLKAKRTRILGLLLSDITNPFFAQILRGAEDCALANGYVLIALNSDDKVDREVQMLSVLRSCRVDGILLVVAPNTGTAPHILNLLKSGIPIVCLDRVPENIPLDCVSVNNVQGSQVCVRHLIQQGHRQIGIIAGSSSLATAKERLKGYLTALQEAGIKPDPLLIKEGDFRQESGYRLGKELLLAHRRPTAVFISSGLMTVGFVQALNETRLRCPEDIAIASFDDLPLSEIFRPHITAVVQPAYQLGREGAQLLIDRLQHKVSSPVTICLDPELKIRDSSSIRQDHGCGFNLITESVDKASSDPKTL